MARVTIEDCLEKVTNRFTLVLVATKRARQLMNGHPRTVESSNKDAVTALREIAAGSVEAVHRVEEDYEVWPLQFTSQTIRLPF